VTRYRNLLLFVVLAAVWGAAFMAIKAGLEFFPPVLFAAIRYDVAGILMLAYAWYAVDDWIPRGRSQWTLVAIGAILMIAAYHAFLFVGETSPDVTSAAAAVVVSLSPVLTAGFSRLFLPSERISVLGFVGLLLGLVGVVLLALDDPAAFLAAPSLARLFGERIVGELLVFAAAASFAFGTVLTQRVDTTIPIETMEAWAMLGGALVMHVVSLGLGEPQSFVVTTESLLALGYLSLVASAAGFLIYFDLLARLGPVEINLVSYVAPIFAALTGWVILGELVDASTVAGFLVIFTGFALLKRDALRAEVVRFQNSRR
jgi:drug/metabolite transporter (DMT)-like permease